MLPQNQNLIDPSGTLNEIRRNTNREIQIAEALLHNDTGFGVFRVPCKLNRVCTECGDVSQLRHLIFDDMQFAASEPNYYHITVSQTSKIFIKDHLLPKVKNEVSSTVENLANQEFSVQASLLLMVYHQGR